MALDNEQIVRNAYQVAEVKDIAGWIGAFTDDGTFTDESIGVTYRGGGDGGLAWPVENFARAFPDMHRELYQVYVADHIVVVQLALQGTHLGPLHLPAGTLPPTGMRMDAPCCDVFELAGDKIKRFDCYPEASIILTQLGVIGNLADALQQPANA
jgi:ketosteroid isomerase-like protein